MLKKLGEQGLNESGNGSTLDQSMNPPTSRRPSLVAGLDESQITTSKRPTPNREPRSSANRRTSTHVSGGRRGTKIGVASKDTRQVINEPTVSVTIGGGEFNMVARPGRLAAINVIRSMDNGTEQDSTIPQPARSHYSSSHLSVDSDIEDFQMFMTETRHPAIVIDVLSDPHDKTIVSEFDELCNELLACLGELEMSIEELTLFKGM
jgi:hypothetical protein